MGVRFERDRCVRVQEKEKERKKEKHQRTNTDVSLLHTLSQNAAQRRTGVGWEQLGRKVFQDAAEDGSADGLEDVLDVGEGGQLDLKEKIEVVVHHAVILGHDKRGSAPI
jgi:hypothetical protein